MTAEPDWRAPVITPEPPPGIRLVRDTHDGKVMDRLGEECDYCGPGHSLWRWRHNGGVECWMEMDGIGPWEGWE